MKNLKTFALLISTFTFLLFSCQSEEFINDDKENNLFNLEGAEFVCDIINESGTRAANNQYLDLANDPIKQMQDMSLTMHVPMITINNNIAAFSVHGSNGSVVLHDINDPSVGNRRVWEIFQSNGKYKIKGLQGDRKGRDVLVTVGNTSNNELQVGVQNNPSVSYIWDITQSPTGLPNRYRIKNLTNHYLQGYANNNGAVRTYKTISKYSDWEILPKEDFDMIEVMYAEEAGDLVTASWQTVVSNIELDNRFGSTEGQLAIKMSRTLTNSSHFSETNIASLTNQTTITNNVGTPEVQNGSISLSNITSKTWNFVTSKTETEQVVLDVNATFPVPPGTYFKAKAMSLLYKANITYIAKYRGRTTGRIIYLKGKWEGNIYNDTKIVISDHLGNFIDEIPTTLIK